VYTVEKLALDTWTPLSVVAHFLGQLEQVHGREKVLTKKGNLTKWAFDELTDQLRKREITLKELDDYIKEVQNGGQSISREFDGYTMEGKEIKW
jgi:hypothetical protein